MNVKVEFIWSDKYPSGDILRRLFEGFDCSKYTWEVDNEHALDEANRDLFESRMYTGEDFEKAVSKKAESVTLVSLKAFDGKAEKIASFDDYLDSDCQLMLYVIDGNFIDIYCKNQDELKFFYDRAKLLEAEELCYADCNEDMRSAFCA